MNNADATRRAAKRAYNQAYYAANREHAKEQARLQRKRARSADVEAVREAQRVRSARYRASHPQRVSATNATTYANRKGAILSGDSDIEWRSVGDRDAWRCHLCHKPVLSTSGTYRTPMGATVDHLVPLVAGGSHTWSNVSLAHWSCNVRRRDGGAAQLRLI